MTRDGYSAAAPPENVLKESASICVHLRLPSFALPPPFVSRESEIQVRIGEMLRPLPIVEHWDCHNCGDCCRNNIIRLDADDLARLKEQRWDEHPDFCGVRVIVSHGLVDETYALAQQADGACVFLTAEGRCRIHELHGYDAKPRICKTFPLQIVPMENGAILTTRRSCPSAATRTRAAGRGASGDRREGSSRRRSSGRRSTSAADSRWAARPIGPMFAAWRARSSG